MMMSPAMQATAIAPHDDTLAGWHGARSLRLAMRLRGATPDVEHRGLVREGVLRRAVELAPADSNLRNNLAATLVRVFRYDEARAAAEAMRQRVQQQEQAQ